MVTVRQAHLFITGGRDTTHSEEKFIKTIYNLRYSNYKFSVKYFRLSMSYSSEVYRDFLSIVLNDGRTSVINLELDRLTTIDDSLVRMIQEDELKELIKNCNDKLSPQFKDTDKYIKLHLDIFL